MRAKDGPKYEGVGAPDEHRARVPALEPELRTALRAREGELEDLRDRYLRLAAELENVRKRSAKEQSELVWRANDELAREILQSVDNIERALAHAEESDKDALVQGIALIESMLLQALEKFGIRRFSSIGERFDPERHEAIQTIPSSDVSAGHVAFETQKGYMHDDRLLRPARVVLSKGAAPRNERK
jgi:molecular chaperone GrpE